MLPDLSEIKAKRKQFSITQSQLAEFANVSQSLIAKIESNSVVPSYANAKRLLDALESLQEQHSLSAKDLLQGHIVLVRDNDSVKKAVSIMERKAISQLPVVNANGACVGSITEANVLKKIGRANGTARLSDLKVSGLMDEAFPSIQQDTPMKVIQTILEHNPAVLVSAKGKIKGIITKSDLLKAVLKKR